MDPLTGLAAVKAVQAVTSAATDILSPSETENPENSGGFAGVLRGLLSPDQENMVNEEELFAALVQQRIGDLKGEAAAEEFAQAFSEHKSAMARKSDGYVPVEDAANAALQDLVASETLTAEEGDTVYSQSFKAAQLDDNHSALFDGRGSAQDGTIAVQKMESALAAAQAMIEKLESGEVDAPDISLNSDDDSSVDGSGDGSNGPSESLNATDGAEGFLWKPESESNGKLVVLLPTEFRGDIQSVVIKNGLEILEEGDFAGDDHNGNRPHYRFDKAGGDYPDNVEVEVRMKDGTVKTYNIGNPGDRYD